MVRIREVALAVLLTALLFGLYLIGPKIGLWAATVAIVALGLAVVIVAVRQIRPEQSE